VGRVRSAVEQPHGRQRVKSVHATGTEQRDADDGRGHVTRHAEVDVGQDRRQQGGAEGGPFQQGMGEAAGEGPVHRIGDHRRLQAFDRRRRRGLRKVGTEHEQQQRQRADDPDRPGEPVRQTGRRRVRPERGLGGVIGTAGQRAHR
jgi:hypothetical protein